MCCNSSPVLFLNKTAGKTLWIVVYPELYRKRFCEAMDKYFTIVHTQ